MPETAKLLLDKCIETKENRGNGCMVTYDFFCLESKGKDALNKIQFLVYTYIVNSKKETFNKNMQTQIFHNLTFKENVRLFSSLSTKAHFKFSHLFFT